MALDYSRNTLVNNASLVSAINDELEKIGTALSDGLSRSGDSPNAMGDTLDMGSNNIINVGSLSAGDLTIDGVSIDDQVTAAAASAAAASASAASAAVSSSLAAGSASLAEQYAEEAKAASETVMYVPDIAALRALTGVQDGQAVRMTTTGRAGDFYFDSSDLSAEVSEDSQSGIYVPPDSDPTGASGAHVRQFEGAVSVKWFGAMGAGIDDGLNYDSGAIRAAGEFAIRNDLSVYIPTGEYICEPNTLLFTFSESVSRRFSIFGDGPTSVLRIGDGLIENYKRLLDFRPSLDMETVAVRDMVLDQNARGSAPPGTPYGFEQAHCLRFAGAEGTVTGLLEYRNVTIKDPVGDGMNNQGLGLISTWKIISCREIDRTRSRSSIQQSYMAEELIISDFTGESIESEPVANLESDKLVLISNTSVRRLDMGGANRVSRERATYKISNTVSLSVAIAFCNVQIDNSELHGINRVNYVGTNCRISDSELYQAYDETTGQVTAINFYGNPGEEHDFVIQNCSVLIDYEGALPVPATGYLIAGDTACPEASDGLWRRRIIGCKFDPRAANTINCYRNGDWYLKDNEYACSELVSGLAAIRHDHGGGLYACAVTVEGGDFRNVAGHGFRVSNTAATGPQGSLTLLGTMLGPQSLSATKGSGGSLSANDGFLNNSRVVQVESLPSAGLAGDTVSLVPGSVLVGTPLDYVAAVTSSSAPGFVLTRQKGVKRGPTADRPDALVAADAGLAYLDTDLDANGKPIWWSGAEWVDATAAVI